MHNIAKNKDSGFTLFEVMISFVVFALGMTAVVSMQMQAIKQNAFAHKVGIASTLAQDKMEYIRWYYNKFFVDGGTSDCPPPGDSTCVTATAECKDDSINFYGVDYLVCWTICDVASCDPDPPPYEINVYVNWVNKADQRRTINYTSTIEARE